MCGIIGYIGNKQAQEVLLTGLKRMEYRGYDSAGIATHEKEVIKITKSAGAVEILEQKLSNDSHTGTTGIGHTRWATHGEPSDSNAHPHQVGSVTIVHNGIIENYISLKDTLEASGYIFTSTTDTEVLAALIDKHYKTTKDLSTLFTTLFLEVVGAFGIAVLFSDRPNEIVVARRSSPVLISKVGDAVFIASDQYALVGHAKDATVLQDGEIAICSKKSIEILSIDNHKKNNETIALAESGEESILKDFKHYMKKEIFEQPESIARTISGRINDAQKTGQLGGLNLTNKQLRGVKSLLLVGCGTAYHAGLAAKYLLEPLIKIPIHVEFASELRYRNAPFNGGELAIAISQSGETADTIACVKELQLKGIPVLGIVNVIGSTLARLVDGGTYTHAGPEISVASTKAFSSQVTTLLLLGLHLSRQRDMTEHEGDDVLSQIKVLPHTITKLLEQDPHIENIAKKLMGTEFIMVLGRDTLYPIALETALKMKEITYIPTDGYPSGEMKHGPHALLSKDMTVIFQLGQGVLYEKSLNSLSEIQSRNPRIIILCDDPRYVAKSDEQLISLPYAGPLLQPILFAVAGQLLAYHTAVALNKNVDKPRNLAKSVTVE